MDDLLFQWVAAEIQPTDTILDLGCGVTNEKFIVLPNKKLFVDVHPPYLDIIKKEQTVIRIDLSKEMHVFIDNSYDIILLLDVIEHLEKDMALRLIGSAKAIARKKVIIYTPEGFTMQEIDGYNMGGAYWQTHRCGFTNEELTSAGFIVRKRNEDIILKINGVEVKKKHNALYGVFEK